MKFYREDAPNLAEIIDAITSVSEEHKHAMQEEFERALMYGRSDLRLVTDSECQICKEQDAQHENN